MRPIAEKHRNVNKLSLECGLTAHEVAQRLGGEKARRAGNGYSTLCPAHDDTNNSLSITQGDNGGLVVHCHAGCSQAAVIAALEDRGISVAPPPMARSRARGSIATLERQGYKFVAAYAYRDRDGHLLHENVRLELYDQHGVRVAKTFRQRRPNGAEWDESIVGVPRVPYRLPELLESGDQPVHVTEGEMDAERLASLGLVATSIASPSTCDVSALRGRVVYLHEDNDLAGRKKSAQLAAALAGIASAVHIVRYVDTPDKGDVSDWLDQGHGREELLERCKECEVARAQQPDWPEMEGKTPRPRSQPNIQAFLDWRGAILRHNAFTLRYEVTLDGKTRELDEDEFRALRLEADRLGLCPQQNYFDDVCKDLARRESLSSSARISRRTRMGR